MVGLSHAGLRELCRSYLPAGARTLWPTEMLNSNRLPFEELGSTPETMKEPNCDYLVPQILGNEVTAIRASIEKLAQWGAVGIDINMGCPVQKALRHNYGVALMGDPNYAAQVVAMAVQSSELPVSVKLRVYDKDQDEKDFVQFIDGLIKAGAAWLCLHPRPAAMKRRGAADWQQIANLKARVPVPIIGNGDIQTSEDAWTMLEQTNCDLVMAGRALAARPWLLWQIGEEMGLPPPSFVAPGSKAPRTPEEEAQEYGRSLLQLLQICRRLFTASLALRKMRFHIRTTSVWLDFGHKLMALSCKATNLDELENEMRSFFENSLRMFARTNLRE